MKLTKRILSLLLAFAMVCTVVPVGLTAGAEEAVTEAATETESVKIPDEAESTESDTDAVGTPISPAVEEGEGSLVNPLYADYVDTKDLKPHQPAENPDAVTQASFVSISSAAPSMRRYMKYRTETFTVYVQHSSNNRNTVLAELLAEVEKHTGVAKEGDSIYWQYAGLTYSYERVASGSKYNWTFEITPTYYTTAAQESELDTAVTQLLSQLGVRYKSDYEKVCAVYNYMCENITYDYDHLDDTSYYLQFTPYAALVNKTAVCQGYALLFYRLMLELGVDCRVIAGIGGDDYSGYGPHGWNIVELNGLYYNLDSTWDAGCDEYYWFLCSTTDFPNHYRYMEYETVAFHYDYPIASESYTEGSTAEAEEYFYGGYCGDEAIWLIDRFGSVTITGSGEMYDYPYSASMEYLAPWRYWEDEITTVVVEDGITEIGEYTFCKEDNLVSVTLPDTLEVIGKGAFSYCSSLEQITIPDSVTTIVGSAFRESGLTSIVIPDSVVSYDLDFHYCYNLKTVVLGTGITEIPEQAFYDCHSLTDITFRGEITSISRAAFANCHDLTDFTLPESVTYIGTEAFSGCTGLTSFTIPANVTNVGDFTFYGCTNLEEVIFEGGPTLGRSLFSATYGSVETIRFLGEVPVFNASAFNSVVATAYYPAGVTGWTADVLQNYGGEITWVASAHTHRYEATVIEPTCTEGGYTTYQCALCVDSYVTDYTDPLGHSYGEWYAVTEATCTTDGEERHNCQNCDHSETQVVPSPGHSYESVVTEATCTDGGYTTHTCTVCGDSYVDDEVEALGHDYESVATEATCTEGGYTTHTCARCGDSYVGSEVEALGHSYESVTIEPTCTEGGFTTHTCTRCGDSYVDSQTEALGHSYEPVTIDPTCEEQGYTTHTCTVCSDSYVDSYVSALGHNHSYALTTEPTLTSTGALTGTCFRCGGTVTVELPMLNEEDYTYEVTLEPTDDENGTAVYTWNVTDYGTITIEVRLRKLSGLPMGDLNDDGDIDIFDANLIVAWYNETIELDEDQLEAADVNGNGEIDIFDANLIVAYYNEIIDVFPAE